ncbi:hypothetical protein EDB85DRAFT_2151997 [Lactarius pseudohatsudake]|nr:hypothetical protein EDB85DRAFT_2151997 [Lactarius pseudohatsudake]
MATNNIVSKAEIELLSIACRVDTALRYRDENGADDNWIRQGIEDEMLGINEVFASEEERNTVPSLPAFLRMIGERTERALELNEVMNLDDLSTEAMKTYCTSIANNNPQWSPFLTMHSPRDLAPQMPSVTEWWLPGEPTIEDEENAEDAAAEAAAEEEDGDGDSDDEVQIVDAPDTAGDVQPRRSERNAKGKAPARADVDASDGSGDVEMGEAVDNQKTPKKFQPVKRAIVVSPTSEVPAKRQQRRPSTAAKAAKAAGRLLNSEFCGPCQNYNVEECKPQADAPKSYACALCASRKVPCNPPAAWAVALKKALKEAAKVKLEAKNHKRSTTSIMEELPVTLEGLQERLDSMEAEAIAFQDTSEANTKAFREAMESRMDALQDTLYNIDIMMRAVCMRNSITPSTLALRIPPVPLFVPAAPSPSPTAGPSSIASTFSSMSSAAGFDISQLSITAPLARVASGSGAGNTLTPVPLSRTPSLNRGRGGASRPPSRASSVAGSKAPSAAGSKAPSAAGSRASSRTRD